VRISYGGDTPLADETVAANPGTTAFTSVSRVLLVKPHVARTVPSRDLGARSIPAGGERSSHSGRRLGGGDVGSSSTSSAHDDVTYYVPFGGRRPCCSRLGSDYKRLRRRQDLAGRARDRPLRQAIIEAAPRAFCDDHDGGRDAGRQLRAARASFRSGRCASSRLVMALGILLEHVRRAEHPRPLPASRSFRRRAGRRAVPSGGRPHRRALPRRTSQTAAASDGTISPREAELEQRVRERPAGLRASSRTGRSRSGSAGRPRSGPM